MPEVIHNWNMLVLRVVCANDYEDTEDIIAFDKDSLFLKYQSHLYRDLMEVRSP